jgi:hypothetical protein
MRITRHESSVENLWTTRVHPEQRIARVQKCIARTMITPYYRFSVPGTIEANIARVNLH